VVRRQLAWQVGELSEAWIPINAGGSPDDVLRLAEAALAAW
jgi:hypothetical protein